MNGYTLMSNSYRKLMNEGKIDKEKAEKEIRIFDFLATCDRTDFCRMVDSSAFNDIISAYIEAAAENSGIDQKSQEMVKNQKWGLFDQYSAEKILQKYGYLN